MRGVAVWRMGVVFAALFPMLPCSTTGVLCRNAPYDYIDSWDSEGVLDSFENCECRRGSFKDLVIGPPTASWCTQCADGQTTVGIGALDSSACFGCIPDTVCVCPVGWYLTVVASDSGEDHESCVVCPQNTTTTAAGSVGISNCVCARGFFAHVASAGENSGTQQCLLCPPNMTTADLGARDIRECFCAPGSVAQLYLQTSFLSVAFGMCIECKPHFYNLYPGTRASTCTKCPQDTATRASASTNISQCLYYMPDMHVTARPVCLRHLSSELATIQTARDMLNSLATWHIADRVLVLAKSASAPGWQYPLNPLVLRPLCGLGSVVCPWSPMNNAPSLNPSVVYRITGTGDTTISESTQHRLATTREPDSLCVA